MPFYSLDKRDTEDPRVLRENLEHTPASITATDGEDGTASITVQVLNQDGNEVGSRYVVRLWLADTVNTAPDATDKTAFAVATGVELDELTAQADYRILTDATGTAVCTLTAADGTYYAHAEIDGQVVTGTITVTGN